jgi:hypothetical protein
MAHAAFRVEEPDTAGQSWAQGGQHAASDGDDAPIGSPVSLQQADGCVKRRARPIQAMRRRRSNGVSNWNGR